MIKELSSSQLKEYKKMLKTILEGIDSAIGIRSGLIEYNSANKYMIAQHDSLNDPEPYYHFKLFDKAIGIVRLYTKNVQFTDDPEQKNFHFAIRCYNFNPDKDFNLPLRHTIEHDTYGDFKSFEDIFPYFFRFSKQLMDTIFKEDPVQLEIF